jgi:uncharacterized DUF497 family protein
MNPDVSAGISCPGLIRARYPDPDHSAPESRYLTFGATFAGRCLVKSYTERGDTIRVISARAMTPRERRAYED